MEQSNQRSNSPLSTKRVHYTENNQEYIQDAGDNFSVNTGTTKSSVNKYLSEAHSEISNITSIFDGEDDGISLRKKLEEYEYNIKVLEKENKKINEGLQNEKKRTANLEKKLQFVKDNQEVFMRLKEAYINMKYNEAAGRKIKEIREKCSQTWEGTLCSSCLESEELRRQIDIMIQKYAELFVVSPGEMERLMNTVKYLKDLIDRREESWSLNIEREHKLHRQIAILEDENTRLREAISKIELNEVIPGNLLDDLKLEQKLLEERKIEEMQKFIEGLTKDSEQFKRIVIKYEKRYRELKERYPAQTTNPLNDKETKIVNQIIMKYNAKSHQKKHQDDPEGSSYSPSMASERKSPNRRPSSPVRSGSSRDKTRQKSSERAKSCSRNDKNTESAIMMMDCLFE